MNWNQWLRQWHKLLGFFGYEPELIPVESSARSDKTQPGTRLEAVEDQRGSPFASAKPTAPTR